MTINKTQWYPESIWLRFEGRLFSHIQFNIVLSRVSSTIELLFLFIHLEIIIKLYRVELYLNRMFKLTKCFKIYVI